MKNAVEIKIGIWTSICSFAIGTLLFLTFIITKYGILAYLGFYYLIVIIPVNILVLLIIIASAFLNKERWIEHLKTIGLMLLNIPIAWLYLILLNFYC
ncbi:hypothetical protein [Pedobacter ureilyticus]|uniref:Branched-chain amino acid:cation transporter, LIVCS family n=1 Tax=Pedobacter ureilyticus TaxID=1393051 RepID=A0ABW9J9K3_9SPHI|nr:hypothetical protein [Pedobacter helvus]